MMRGRPLSDSGSNRSFIIGEFGLMAITGYMLIIKGLNGKLSERGWNMLGLGGMLIIIVTIVICWGNFFKDAIPEVLKKIKKKCKRRTTEAEGE